MATRTPAAKRPSRKVSGGKAAAGKAAPKKAVAAKSAVRLRKPAAKAPGAEAASLRELVARLGKLELTGLASRLVQGWRKDIEAIVEANRKSYSGLQAIVRRQTEQIKEAIAELQSVGKVVTTVGAKESARSVDSLALASLELALADIRELAALAASTQREAFEVVHRRVTEHIDEVQQMLRK